MNESFKKANKLTCLMNPSVNELIESVVSESALSRPAMEYFHLLHSSMEFTCQIFPYIQHCP